jgi:nucleoside-diphosphate-sugar epimerase
MRVLVTGSSGLVGRTLMQRLNQMPGFEAYEFRTLQLRRDICDFRDARVAVDGMDAVIHLAATLNYRQAAPEEIHRVNVKGTRCILDASVQAGVSSLVIASSQGVYAQSPACPGPLAEDADLAARDAYGQSKIEVELLCQSHPAWHRCHIAMPRIAAVYGPGSLDRDDFLSECVRSARKMGQITVFDKGRRIRDLVWVDDVADAMVKLLGMSGFYNLGGDYPYTSREIAETVTAVIGGKVVFDKTRSETVGLWMDLARLRAVIPYEPVSLRTGLVRLLEADSKGGSV